MALLPKFKLSRLFRRRLYQHLSTPIFRAIPWEDGDAEQFEAFCRSGLGQKLLEFLRQYVASMTFKAVYRESVSANAEARGAQQLLALIHQARAFPLKEESREADEELEPLPSRGVAVDGRHRGLSGGFSAIR